MKELFFEKMKNIGWNVSSEKISLKNVNIDRRAIARLAKAPKEFIDFISSYSTLNNAQDDIWFYHTKIILMMMIKNLSHGMNLSNSRLNMQMMILIY